MFVADTHVAKEPIPIADGMDVYVGIDFGLTPAATFGQKIRGRWLIQRELVAFDMGIVRFAEMLRMELANSYALSKGVHIYGDPAGDFRAQTDETTPFQILRGAGLKAYPTHTNSVDLRLESVSSQLNKMVEGKAGFIIDKEHCPALIKGFEGGYGYKRMQVSGEKYDNKPDKNMFSHVHDALQYMMLGAGEGRALISGQSPAKVVVASRDFDVFAKRRGAKRSTSVWAR